jgi:hypothetical protein
VIHVAIEKAEHELAALENGLPARKKRMSVRVLRMSPLAAEVLCERVAAGNLGAARSELDHPMGVLFRNVRREVPLWRGQMQPGEHPYLVAHVGMNHRILLQAATNAAGCVESGRSGRI